MKFAGGMAMEGALKAATKVPVIGGFVELIKETKEKFEALTDQLSEAVEDNSESEEKLAELLPAMLTAMEARRATMPKPCHPRRRPARGRV